MANTVAPAAKNAGQVAAPDPFEFHVYGPRNLSPPSWKDLLRSSWKDPTYRRMVIACFIQGVYLLELDRQEKRDDRTSLAPQWWRPFRYRLTQSLVDARDGSVYGAVLEWDRRHAAALPLFRPSGAPAAVVALRGTLLRAPTALRDVADDLRFLAWDSLKGSVRFAGALAALRDAARRHGGNGNGVCVAGHSLGAGFALQVGKALAKEGVLVECHVFNPPSVSLATSLRGFAEMAGDVWGRVRAWLPYVGASAQAQAQAQQPAADQAQACKWMPHLYINTNDYICCYYTDSATGTATVTAGGGAAGDGNGKTELAKIVLVSKGPTKFLDAHGLNQWWADDVELQVALNHSKLIGRQLRSLYTPTPAPPAPAPQPSPADVNALGSNKATSSSFRRAMLSWSGAR
ncbi:hypothetical protein PR202_ga10217 [Eleusine coracana subsp. coracana]|uniref:GDSL esterase/lipase n=1 Tax=Eleusine coracana subsp. coracana TaxID=191504 RepID=A0AAV5C679_ELECO|nr:hypothetical protein QOZ80_1AG0027790 [Eleusine coracana subsp. coracana]GJM93643.1 hypothetical protein PR202_ga10217 [Eleusine coracana subsp. coracana]